MLYIYHSNKLTMHKELISNLIKNDPLKNPLTQEIIVVQNLQMSQWLQIELAQSLGITANIAFPLSKYFIWDMLTKVLSNILQPSAFTKSAMTWKIMKILPSLLHEREFELLKQYLHEDTEKKRLYQLSRSLACLFNKYVLYRPKWVESWTNKQLVKELSNNQRWQKCLWLALITYTKKLNQPQWHQANICQQFIQYAYTNVPKHIILPKRIFICGISELPPIYLQVLNALGKHIDIHLMFTNPCRYHWRDTQSFDFVEKLKRHKRKDYRDKYIIENFKRKRSPDTFSSKQKKQARTNPLLSSWGKIGSDHLYLLSQLESSDEVSAFINSPCNCLLHHVQQDILDLEDHSQLAVNKEGYSNSFSKKQLRKQDKSLTFHSCHSPQREVEILQDYLLRLFEEESTLKPKDIIVMVSDINRYAPCIQAVFSNISDERNLPFFISHQKNKKICSFVQTFLSLLDLPNNRCTTEQVLELLEIRALSHKFSIYDDDLLLLRRWINESGIRWGLNDENIAMLHLPVTGTNTWSFGLNRMLLGYAMHSHAGTWNNILPYDECAGLPAQLAGRLAVFIDALISWKSILNQKKTLSEWLPLCQCLLDAFFETNAKTKPIFMFILQQWKKTIESGIAEKYEDIVPLLIIRDALAICLNEENVSQYYLANAINFCTIIPMHAIPFKVVCLLGMNNHIYPRLIPPLSFDLMAEKPQCGDSKHQDVDRYLFLEALNSSSQYFYLSYIGHSMRDNQPHYPSSLANELLDYISQSFCLEGDEHLNIDNSAYNVKEHLVTKHTRVPFAIENFLPNSTHQSYAIEWLSSAKKHGDLQTEFCTSLASMIEHNNVISLAHILSFYRHPIRTFFQKRLKVNFVHKNTQLLEHEPFIVNTIQQYAFNKRLLQEMISEKSPDVLFDTFKATGELPAEQFGVIYWKKQIQDLKPLSDKIKLNYHAFSYKQFDEPFENTRLVGTLRNIQKNGIIRYRPANLTIHDGFSLWIEHLIFCLTVSSGESCYWGKYNSEWCFEPVDKGNAKVYLQQLINGYQDGMNAPLPLFYKSSWNWLMSSYNKTIDQFSFKSNNTSRAAHIQLIQSLQGTYNLPGEMKDSYNSRVFKNIDSNLLEKIQRNAQTYLLPMASFIKNKTKIS